MNNNSNSYSNSLTNYLYYKAEKNGIPIGGTFELSPICNFNCKMCYVKQDSTRVSESFSINSYNKWLNIAEQAKAEGTLFLLITGGEPMLVPYFWDLYEKLYYDGFIITVNTNASQIDETAVKKFTKLRPRRLNISLYGADEETYSNFCGIEGMFEKVNKAITLLQNENINIRLNTSLTPANVDNLKPMIEYALNHNLNLNVAEYMFPKIRTTSHTDNLSAYRLSPDIAGKLRIYSAKYQLDAEYYKEFLNGVINHTISGNCDLCNEYDKQNRHCRAGRSSFWITWDGYMLPCGMLNTLKYDMNNSSFSSVWKKVNAESNEILLPDKCYSCKAQKICHSCAAVATAENGTQSTIPKYLCEMVKSMQEVAKKELGKINSGGQKL